ncbi:MAG: hypothetical protein JNL08_05970 [Planctomycetes bacterium]|nr:hypothetical protein [Planctomycetota bacterium]
MPIRRRTALALALALPFAACAAGPHQVRRTIDDWDHNLYVNSPWFNAALWVVPVIPTLTLGAWLVDFCVTDPWVFWFDDAWDGAGTGFVHLPVEPTDGQVQSLLLDRSGWTRVEK